MVMRESVGLTLAGLAVGLPVALLMGRLLATILYDLNSFDPLVFVLPTCPYHCVTVCQLHPRTPGHPRQSAERLASELGPFRGPVFDYR
jgi:ABC-type antimicrobial peptide transport system permease subunit